MFRMSYNSVTRRISLAGLSAVVVLMAREALACPTCKDTLTDNYVQAYGMSIIFMMSMPFIIFGLLSAYFYYEVCKARRQKAAEQTVPAIAKDQMAAPMA